MPNVTHEKSKLYKNLLKEIDELIASGEVDRTVSSIHEEIDRFKVDMKLSDDDFKRILEDGRAEFHS